MILFLCRPIIPGKSLITPISDTVLFSAWMIVEKWPVNLAIMNVIIIDFIYRFGYLPWQLQQANILISLTLVNMPASWPR